MKRETPIGIKSLAIFFAFGACMCALTIGLLLFPGSALDSLWRLNPEAYAAFQRIGGLSILLVGIVGVACALAAIGARQKREKGSLGRNSYSRCESRGRFSQRIRATRP
jgi:hypothetical protein